MKREFETLGKNVVLSTVKDAATIYKKEGANIWITAGTATQPYADTQ